jgi:hypothetical protein
MNKDKTGNLEKLAVWIKDEVDFKMKNIIRDKEDFHNNKRGNH